MILEELGLPYEITATPFSDVKKPEYLKINPNGRLPSIYDPNTDLTLWESGAIVEYLIDKYDTDHKISFPRGTQEDYLAKQWLFFQATGQGPYYGQAVWFKIYHPEPLPSARKRYHKEIHRVTGVLEGFLAEKKQAQQASGGSDGPWLVGDRYSYADIAFIPWQTTIAAVIETENFDTDEYPIVKDWLERMKSRDSIKTVLAHKAH